MADDVAAQRIRDRMTSSCRWLSQLPPVALGSTDGPGERLAVTRSCRATPRSPVRVAGELFARAAELIGPRLQSQAQLEGLSTVTEARHLQPTFRAALEAVAAAAQPPPLVSPSLSHGLKSEWPRLGNFDVSLQWPGADVFGELKCAADEVSLSACGWDAAKCVFCLNHGVGAGMLLVAAAPAGFWERKTMGIELLATGQWDMADIRGRYAAGFRVWERDGYRPTYVYRHFCTRAVARTNITVAGAPWVLGVASVEAASSERMDWTAIRVAR